MNLTHVGQSFVVAPDSDLSDFAVQSFLSGGFEVRFCTVLNGLITMSFSSTVQVLKVNEVEKGISKKTGQPWERHTAECCLLGDDGAIECVGRLSIPTALRGEVKVGTFRAGFALQVPTFGDQKGDITARLTSLSAVPVRSSAVSAASAKASV